MSSGSKRLRNGDGKIETVPRENDLQGMFNNFDTSVNTVTNNIQTLDLCHDAIVLQLQERIKKLVNISKATDIFASTILRLTDGLDENTEETPQEENIMKPQVFIKFDVANMDAMFEKSQLLLVPKMHLQTYLRNLNRTYAERLPESEKLFHTQEAKDNKDDIIRKITYIYDKIHMKKE
jgi:hypothetical protein